MQLVVNDLSAKFPCEDVETGHKIMKSFIETYYQVKRVIDNDSVLMDKDYRSFELAKDYRLEHWLSDKRIDVELKRRFRSILNRSYTFDSEEFEREYQWRLEAEFRYGELVSRSCQLVYETEGVLISFLSDPYWENAVVKGIYTYLTKNGEMLEEEAGVPNVSCPQNTAAFCSGQERHHALRRREAIRSGMDIYLCREERFPNLVFCENALKQLQTEIGGAEAGQVYRRLTELQEAASEMKGKFDKDKLTHATPESAKTLQMFREEHTIMLPDGKKQLFSWHVRFTGGYARTDLL